VCICSNVTAAHRLCHSVSKQKCLGHTYECASDSALKVLSLIKLRFLTSYTHLLKNMVSDEYTEYSDIGFLLFGKGSTSEFYSIKEPFKM